MGFATTVLRLVTGATMAGHGIQKLTTSLGGHGPEGTAQAFEQMGLRPGRHFGMATGAAEAAGGTMMALGLATPLACSLVTGVMVGAITKVHLKKGFWATNGGFEYNLGILASTFAIAGAGGGPLTLDGLRGKKHQGLGWAVLQLALGAGAAAGALAISDRQACTAPEGPLSPAADASGEASADGDDDMVDLGAGDGPSGRKGAVQ